MAVFTPRPLQIPSLTTNYSAENQAFSNLGQTLGSLPGDIKKQAEADAKKAAYAAAAKSGDLTSLGRALILNGDAQSGAAILGLSQKDALNKSVMEGIKGWSSPASPASTAPVAGPASLIQNESGGNWQAQNNAVGSGGAPGHFGRLQFSQARIQDAINAGALPPGTTPQAFMQSPELQKQAEAWHFSDIDQKIQQNGFDKLIGQSINGVPITVDGLRAVAHLGGTDGMRKFVETGGRYNPADVNGTRLSDYFSRHGGAGGQPQTRVAQAPQAAPVQVAENEADVRRLEQEQATASDARAPGAANAQGFFIPPGPQPQIDAIANDPQVKLWRERLSSPLAIQSEAARGIAQKNLDIATKDAERRLGQTEAVKNYRFYLEEERAAGRQPMSFQDFRKSTAPQTKIEMPPSEKEYDKQSAKDFAELNRDVAKRASTANGKIATLNRLETLLSDPNVRQGAGAQAALQAARIAKGVFGIDTEGLGPAEAVNAISNQFALELRNPSGGAGMPGALSDKDREFLQSLTPGLERTPEGNKLIIDYMKRLAKRDVEIEGLRRDYIKQNKRLDDGFYDKLSEFSEKNPLFPEAAKAAPKAMAAPSAGHVEGGYRFNGGDPSNPNNWTKVQ